MFSVYWIFIFKFSTLLVEVLICNYNSLHIFCICNYNSLHIFCINLDLTYCRSDDYMYIIGYILRIIDLSITCIIPVRNWWTHPSMALFHFVLFHCEQKLTFHFFFQKCFTCSFCNKINSKHYMCKHHHCGFLFERSRLLFSQEKERVLFRITQ